MTQHNANPWRLTLTEAQVMDALVMDGSIKGVARRLGVAWYTVNDHLKRAYLKLDVHHKIGACVKWDRWRQGEGKGLEA